MIRMVTHNADAQHSNTWGTELILLSGQDRSELIERIGELVAFLRSAPETELKDLAFTLNTQEDHQPARLAVVATSVSDLLEKLDRALDRLSDPACRQIRDVKGIYFFAEPLGIAGRLAVLFPGEGAPYLGMLGDLSAHFPEVSQVISQCDRMSREHGSVPLSRFLKVPQGPAERSALEAELKGLGNTMFSVLMVDWALWDLFGTLGVRPDAVAGHSAGELAALWTSGSLVGQLDMPELRRTMDFLEADEKTHGEGSVLLAVGASREAMLELLAQVRRELGDPAEPAPLFLAMDNCPHQTVVIGPPQAMEKVADLLRERKIMHERLPFNRPYHTPMFEPQMGPLARMFDSMEFQSPRLPMYSCSTGERFPNEPEAIHRLAVSHWIQPVEFSRMIRNMHEEGVRIFLELGPRGNLTSFVSDILRGREFLAVAADVPRQPGTTQLHHALGLLFAHHVPMQLGPIYSRRSPKPIAWRKRNPSRPTGGRPTAPGPGRAAVVTQYWNVMGEFLELQETILNQYLDRKRNGRAAVPSLPPASPSVSQPEERSINFQPAAEPVSPDSHIPQVPEHNLPLIQSIQRFLPGQELVVRRCLDLAEDNFGDHHTVGGREVSYVYPERNGQPVVPMTFSLELMAEAAVLLVPGQVVTAIRNVQLVRWLVFDEDFPRTIELSAKVLKQGQSAALLEIRIFDRGHDTKDPEHKGELAAVAMVETAEGYPAPPSVEDFPLTGERPCRIPLDVLYKNLFHGKLFQGVMSMDRYGKEGIQGQIRVLPREELLRSIPDPQFVLDPVLMDVAMHPLAGWHLEQPDQSGRILLPYELGDIRFYGPRPAVDTEMTTRGRIVHESARRFTHSVEVVGPSGRLWCTMQKLKYWRFYLPFGEFNFHGPKDDYFLSENWLDALPEPQGDVETPTAWCVGLLPPRDLEAPGMMLAAARVTLTREELKTFRRLELPDAKKSEWLFGRMAAKDAARILWRRHTGERMVPADISIDPDEQGKPIASPIGRDRPADFPNVSIAHTTGVVAALGSFDKSPGIDLEHILPREDSFLKAAFSVAEQDLLAQANADRDETATRFWCAKEAVSKALGQGLVEGPQSLIVTGFDQATGEVAVELSPRLAERLDGKFADQPLFVRTIRKQDLIIATTLLESARSTIHKREKRLTPGRRGAKV